MPKPKSATGKPANQNPKQTKSQQPKPKKEGEQFGVKNKQ